MEEERKLNVTKVVIAVISAIVLVALIAILTKFLTGKKEAVYVSSENVNSQQTEIVEENVWKIEKDNTTSQNTTTENTITENTTTENTNTQNVITQNIVEQNTVNQNTEAQNTINNEVSGSNFFNTSYISAPSTFDTKYT